MALDGEALGTVHCRLSGLGVPGEFLLLQRHLLGDDGSVLQYASVREVECLRLDERLRFGSHEFITVVVLTLLHKIKTVRWRLRIIVVDVTTVAGESRGYVQPFPRVKLRWAQLEYFFLLLTIWGRRAADKVIVALQLRIRIRVSTRHDLLQTDSGSAYNIDIAAHIQRLVYYGNWRRG